MLVERIDGTLALKTHKCFQLVQKYGGSVSSTLVSEEDIQLDFMVGPVFEPMRVEIEGRETQDMLKGDSILLHYRMHFEDEKHAMRESILSRFP